MSRLRRSQPSASEAADSAFVPPATRHAPRATRLSLLAVLILLLATGLRFHRLDAQSFWNDEGNSARLSERPIAAILEGTASDIHPPLYYLALHGWRALLGDSEFALRALSAFAGVLTVAVVFVLAKRGRSQYSVGQSEKRSDPLTTDPLTTEYWLLATENWQLPAALLAAASPVLVYYSQETRMYALLALLAALSTWALLAWRGGAGRRWAVAYVLLAAAGLYTHYFFPAVMVAQGLVVLLGSWERKRDAERRRGRIVPSSSAPRPSALRVSPRPSSLPPSGRRGRRPLPPLAAHLPAPSGWTGRRTPTALGLPVRRLALARPRPHRRPQRSHLGAGSRRRPSHHWFACRPSPHATRHPPLATDH